MDGSLSANHQYRLNENGSINNEGKLFIFVKLTDSCMKTIETYLKQNKKSNKSNIKFNQNGGEISIPINNGEKRIYSFQISPENKTPEVFECIKQTNKDQLESCGLIEQRLNVHAQEDVYSMTKTKVTEYQKIEDSTKKQTKEIGESSKTILQKKTNKSSNNRLSTPLNPPKQRTTINQDSHLSPTAANQSAVAERPLRERLVHLLAAKTYKKPELLLRLKNDGGIRDDEREQLDSLLSVISTQSKSGEYIILKNILINGEVSYDWPYYPKAEASSVRKRIRDQQANANRSTITTSSASNRLSSTTKTPIVSSNPPPPTTTKPTLPNNRVTTNDERNQPELNDQNPLTDQKMQQLSDMLDKLTNAVSQCEKSDEELSNEIELPNEDDLDEAEKEYNRLVPEYNNLIDYLTNVSEKFSLLEQEFNDEQSNEKAKKIVDEFFQCENDDGFLRKRQRVVQLHFKLKHLKKILERNSPLNDDFETSDDEN